MGEFDIELYYNGVGIDALKEQSVIDRCMEIGQYVFDRLQPIAKEIDEFGGIRIDITEEEGDEDVLMEFDYLDLPDDLIDQIEELMEEDENG